MITDVGRSSWQSKTYHGICGIAVPRYRGSSMSDLDGFVRAANADDSNSVFVRGQVQAVMKKGGDLSS